MKRCKHCGTLYNSLKYNVCFLCRKPKKNPLNKLFLTKFQSKWFNKGKAQAFLEVEWWLRANKYPSNNPIRKFIKDKLNEKESK